MNDFKRFKDSDLNANGISIIDNTCTLGNTSNNNTIANFQNTLMTHRTLNFNSESPHFQVANFLYAMIKSRCDILVPLLAVCSGDNLDPTIELEQLRELRQYLSLLDDYLPFRNIKNPSESALDALFVSKIVDPCFVLNTEIYHRNQNFPYPLNFVCQNEIFHVTPRLDVSFFSKCSHQPILVIGVESKKLSEANNAFFENDKVKMALLGRVMYQVINILDSKYETKIPFLVTSMNYYKLYLFFKHGPGFVLHLVWEYDCSQLDDMIQLVFHLRNLPHVNLTAEVDTLKIAKLNALKSELGHSISSSHKTSTNSSKDNQSNCTSLTGTAGGLTDDISLIDYGILTPHYFNVRRGVQISDSIPVLIKFSTSDKEIRFLNLLNSKSQKDDLRNCTVPILKIFKGHGPYFDGDKSIYQIVFPIFDVLSSDCVKKILSPSLCTKLSTQLMDHCNFLHEQGICHRDIKPSNLALDGKKDLVVLDCDLMSQFEGNNIVYTFSGTKEFSDPDYYANPEIGYNVFELEEYSIQKTIKWMEMVTLGNQDSGIFG